MKNETMAGVAFDSRAGSRAADAIVSQLVEDVRGGRFEAGRPLPTERELCELFNSSRPTVREAISRLQVLGYAKVEPGRRPRAARPTIEDALWNARDRLLAVVGRAEGAAHLEQMRQFIETGAVREATKRAGAVQLARIKAALDANGEAIGRPDFPETDIAFHRAIVTIPGNPVMLALHDMFVGGLLASRPMERDPKAHDELVHSEHAAIFEAIFAHDEVAATERMERHLERSYRSRLSSEVSGAGTGPAEPDGRHN